MLAPDDRTLLIDALRPPEGYTFDRGVGTTFTLNLQTLLVAPLSLALHDVSNAADALGDPVLLLDGVRKYANRLTLFCQAGYVAIPRQVNPLFSFLEQMVVEVEAPNGGVFHPKLWLLRYVSDAQQPAYRLLCLTRNVDFSRSWDLLLRLDGELQDRKVGYGRNAPLAEFLGTLPELGLRRATKRSLGTIALLQKEVRKVQFRAPLPFHEDSLEFIPLGHRKHRPYSLNTAKNRGLIISPFLAKSVLLEATDIGVDHVLLSEAESLRQIDPTTLERFSKIFIFNDAAITPPADERLEAGEDGAAVQADPSRLHAKLYIFEKGGNAKWLIGSANATRAALSGHNVEFMVGLAGWNSRVGIAKVLGETEDASSLRALLAEYEPEEPPEADADANKAEELLEIVRKHLIERRLHLTVRQSDEGEFVLLLASRRKKLGVPEGDVTLRVWPVTLPEDRAREVRLEDLAGVTSFEGMSVLALTAFVAFHLEVTVGETGRSIRFVLNLPVSGMPRSRVDEIVSAVLTDQAQFMRYLRYLLAEELGWLGGLELSVGQENSWDWQGRRADDAAIPLFEDLARAFSRSPQKIDQVTDLVKRLRSTESGRAILPDGFEPLWDTIQAARGRDQ